MERIKQLLASSLRHAPNKRLHSEIHALADEVSAFFGERKLFARYLGAIKRVGAAKARAIFSDVRQSDAREPRKLFFWKCGKANQTSTVKPSANTASDEVVKLKS